MSELIKVSSEKSVTFDKFPTGYEINFIKETHPNLNQVTFEGCVINDFSLMSEFSDQALCFENCEILDYGYPITLNSNYLYFCNTRVNYEKLFFMTNMPNLKKIVMLYDTLEGVMLYKPYIHLLKFFTSIESIKLMMVTDYVTYYDMAHTKVLESGKSNSNMSVLLEAKLCENLRFLDYMPNYFPKPFDGIFQVYDDMNYDIWRANKRFWVNPKFMDFYNTIRRYNLVQIKKELINISKFGPILKEKLGRTKMWYEIDANPIYSYYDLEKLISSRLQVARLNSKVKRENLSPDYSSLYGLFGYQLYNTHGHIILVNSRGNIISDYSIDEKTKKLTNELLPF